MSSLFQRAIERYRSEGPVRFVGILAGFGGETIQKRCETVADFLEDVSTHAYPLSSICRAYYHGFDVKTYCWLGLSDRDPAQFINDASAYSHVNEGYETVVRNDYALYRLTGDRIDAIPELYGVIERGEYHPIHTAETDLVALAVDRGSLVLKPMLGTKGKGFRRIETTGSRITVNGTARSREEVETLVETLSGYVVTEYVDQHDYSASIFAETTNTIRLLTVVDPKTADAHVIRACHRFGSSDSVPTDNWSRGSYAAPVDVDTGTIQPIVDLDGRANRVSHDTHPETGARVAGVDVPTWEETKSVVRDLAELHRPCPIVGWDVVVGPDGPVVIEGNTKPGEHLSQFEDGLLSDGRFRRLVGPS